MRVPGDPKRVGQAGWEGESPAGVIDNRPLGEGAVEALDEAPGGARRESFAAAAEGVGWARRRSGGGVDAGRPGLALSAVEVCGDFSVGDKCQWAEMLGMVFPAAVGIPADQGATSFEAIDSAREGLLQLAFFGFTVDEQGVSVVHLLVGHVVAVVPQDGFIGLHGAHPAVGDPDDAAARHINAVSPTQSIRMTRRISAIRPGIRRPARPSANRHGR